MLILRGRRAFSACRLRTTVCGRSGIIGTGTFTRSGAALAGRCCRVNLAMMAVIVMGPRLLLDVESARCWPSVFFLARSDTKKEASMRMAYQGRQCVAERG